MCIRDRNYSNLLKSVNYYLNDDYKNAATALSDVDSKLKMDSEDFTTVYKWLSSKLSKRISEEAYNAGMTARDKADYDTAIKQFKKCIEADSGNVDAIYYLAWSYKNKGDSKNANKYFKEIYDNFPNSSHYDLCLIHI